jgi:integrase/recombinase XerD
MTNISRTPPNKLAKQLVKHLRPQRPDYNYLRELFRHLRKELGVPVTTVPKKLPVVPTEEEIKKYYEAVWYSKNIQHMVMIKTLLYTGIRVSVSNVKQDFRLCDN